MMDKNMIEQILQRTCMGFVVTTNCYKLTCYILRPTECSLSEIASKYTGELIAAWDCIYAFSSIIGLSPISMEQFAAALAHREHSPLVTEVHMCLLDLILEDRYFLPPHYLILSNSLRIECF